MMQLSFKSQLKSAKERIIEGFATTDSWDNQGERLPLGIAVAAFDNFSKSPKICTAHGREEFAGKVNSLGCGGVAEFLGYTVSDGGVYVSIKVTDDAAWDKVLSGEYTGFSIGGFGKLNQNGEFTYFEIIEISLVGTPVNGDCVFLKVKGDVIMDEESKGLLKSMLDALNKLQVSVDKMATVEATEDAAGGATEAAVMGCKGCQKMQVEKGSDAVAMPSKFDAMMQKFGKMEEKIAEFATFMDAANKAVAVKGVAFDTSNDVSKVAGVKKLSEYTVQELRAMTPADRSKIPV